MRTTACDVHSSAPSARFEADDLLAVVEVHPLAVGGQGQRSHAVVRFQRTAPLAASTAMIERVGLVPGPLLVGAVGVGPHVGELRAIVFHLFGAVGDQQEQRPVGGDDFVGVVGAGIGAERSCRWRRPAPSAGRRCPSVTYTRSPTATSRRGSWFGPLFSGQSCVFHWAIGRFQRIVPLKASRAISDHCEGSRIDSRGPSSMM